MRQSFVGLNQHEPQPPELQKLLTLYRTLAAVSCQRACPKKSEPREDEDEPLGDSMEGRFSNRPRDPSKRSELVALKLPATTAQSYHYERRGVLTIVDDTAHSEMHAGRKGDCGCTLGTMCFGQRTGSELGTMMSAADETGTTPSYLETILAEAQERVASTLKL